MAKKDEFYEEEEEKETEEEAPEKVKVGEKEYSQEELERIVGLGEIAHEAEEKYQTKIDRVWPEYTKGQQKLQSLEAEIKTLKSDQAQKKTEIGQELSPEELRTQARAQAKELGIVTTEEFDALYAQRRAAERLLEDVQDVVSEAEEAGKPKVTTEGLLEFMKNEDYRSPERAYEAMHSEELKKWEADQLKKVKKEGMLTQEASTAGKTKEPETKSPSSREQLAQALSEHFRQPPG